jgi:flagellar protein FlbT
MSLKVELKAGEKLLIGNCVITNSDQRTKLFIDGTAPILREKDILTEKTANSPAKRVYFAIQLMYLDEDISKLRDQYFTLSNDLLQAAPSTLPFIDELNNLILTQNLYKALRIAKKLIEYEQELLDAATSSPSLPTDS